MSQNALYLWKKLKGFGKKLRPFEKKILPLFYGKKTLKNFSFLFSKLYKPIVTSYNKSVEKSLAS